MDSKTKNGSDADFLVTYSEHDYNGQYGTWAMDYEEERLDKVRILTFLLEELATKDIETLRFIQNEVGNKTVNNPQESLGSVRSTNSMAGKDWTKMDEKERRKNWPDIVANMKNN